MWWCRRAISRRDIQNVKKGGLLHGERAHPTLLHSRKRGVFVQSALYRLDAAGSVDLMLVDVVAGRGRVGGRRDHF